MCGVFEKCEICHISNPALKKYGDRRAACEHRIGVAGATMHVPGVGRRCLGNAPSRAGFESFIAVN
jgi:hypothetical protein